MDKVGHDGVATVREGKSLTSEVEVVEGDRGDFSPYPEKMSCELEEPYILLHEKKRSVLHPLLLVLESRC